MLWDWYKHLSTLRGQKTEFLTWLADHSARIVATAYTLSNSRAKVTFEIRENLMSPRCFWTEGFKAFWRQQDRPRIYKSRINTSKKIFFSELITQDKKKRRIWYCDPKIGLECLGCRASLLCDKPRVSSCSICQWQYQLEPGFLLKTAASTEDPIISPHASERRVKVIKNQSQEVCFFGTFRDAWRAQ